MKFDWNLRTNKEFCLNINKCKLDFVIDKNDLCFSFNKGKRILVYVRIDKDIKITNITTLSESKINLSNIKSVIKDIYQIDKFNEEELKNHLLFFITKEFEILNNNEIDKYIIISNNEGGRRNTSWNHFNNWHRICSRHPVFLQEQRLYKDP
jgi:hypothetical protein